MKSLKALVLVIVVAGSVFSSGCASTYVVSSHNERVRLEQHNKALQLGAKEGGGFTVGFDIMQLQGYWAAWKADPTGMAGATFLDTVTTAGAVCGIMEIDDHNKNDDKPAQTSIPIIENNGGTVLVNTGAGSVTYSTKQ